MTPMTISGLQLATAAALLVGSVSFARTIYLIFFHPLAKIPGPKLYALTDWIWLYHLLRGNWPHKLMQLHDKYGSTLRYGPNEVSTIKPEAWKQIYGHKKRSIEFYKKDPRFYDSIAQEGQDIIRADDETHKRQRRVLAHAFSEKALRGQSDIIDVYVNLFMSQIITRAARREPVDIMMWYNFATFDLIGDLAFGKPFGCLEKGVYNPLVPTIFNTIKLASTGQVLQRYPWTQRFASLMIPKKVFESFVELSNHSRQTALDRIERGSNDRQDFTDFILRHNDTKTGMSFDEIAANALLLIAAGSETTATQLTGTTYNLLTNPETYGLLVKEIRERFRSEEEITIHSVNDLPYLLAVFNESFRMYPPVPTALGRLVPPGGDTIDGYYLPENSGISLPQLAAYYSPLNWTDPETFAPERWLGTDPRYANDKRDVLKPFSTGPRDCIGKNLAYVEMRVILVRLLWRFDLKLRPESRGWRDQKVFGVWEKGPLMVDLTPVEQKS